jgi:hypothetical protein
VNDCRRRECSVVGAGRAHLDAAPIIKAMAAASFGLVISLIGLASYAAQARANARACSLGKEAEAASSRVCLPPSSLTNESSQCVSGALVKAILIVRSSVKSVIDN